MISETIELLGKGLYKNIPDVLTLKSIPTVSELEYVGSEEFDKTMIEKILPQAIEEKIDCYELLEIDYQWICRALRILNYGPYYTTSTIFCTKCNSTSRGEYRVNLQTVGCKTLPSDFVNELTISRDEFMDFNGDVALHLLTIREALNCYKDVAFQTPDGRVNRDFARICYMVSSIGTHKNLNPIDAQAVIKRDFSSADYILLKNTVNELTDYGLRAGGTTQCPKCHDMSAAFIALADDKFFRPTMGDLKQWKLDRNSRRDENTSGSKATTV